VQTTHWDVISYTRDRGLQTNGLLMPDLPKASGGTVTVPRKDHAGWRHWVINLVITLVAGAVLWVGIRRYYPFIADDTFISLRYAQRFVDGHGLTWSSGPPVEGYSNLLWVLALSAMRFVGVDLIVAARLLGIVCTLGTIAAVIWWSRSSRRTSFVPAVAAGVGLALAGPIVVWSIGGLEQPLSAVLLATGTILVLRQLGLDEPSKRQLLYASVLFGMLCLTRPDGPIIPAVACGFILVARWRKPQRLRTAITLGLVPALCVVAQELFRVIYYQQWVPNTAYAKVAFTWGRVSQGFHYVVSGNWTLLGLAIPALVVILISTVRPARVDPDRRRRVLFLALAWFTWSGYVTFIGGDIFPGYRHLIDSTVLLALLAVEFWQMMVEPLPLGESRALVDEQGRWRLFHPAVQWTAVFVCLLSITIGERNDSHYQSAISERWEWDCQVTGTILNAAFSSQQPLLATDPAGCAPYFSKLPSLDMMGLNDRYLSHHRPASFGTGLLGHELGSGPYVLRRRPDLVLMAGGGGSPIDLFPSGAQLLATPEFHQQYNLLRFYGNYPHPLNPIIWVRTMSTRIGVQVTLNRIEIPGYLFADWKSHVVARMNDHHQIIADIPENAGATLANIPVGAGNWKLEITGSPGIHIAIVVADSSAVSESTRQSVRLRSLSKVSFVIQPSSTPMNLLRVELVRSSSKP
jgi:arabinofuranosyltransferase